MSSFVTLSDYLEHSVARSPDRPAVVDPSGQTYTYLELDQRANRVASWLMSVGVSPGDRVGICLPKGADSLSCIFGILKVGGVYVPVDYTAPQERNRYIFSHCQIRAAFVDSRCTSIIDEPGDSGGAQGPALPTLMVFGGEEDSPTGSAGVSSASHAMKWVSANALSRHSATRPSAARRGPNDLAYILYTSGSTGVPKGVMLSQENGTSYVDWCSDVFAPAPEDRFTSHAPFHFDLSILDIYLSIKHGATLYIISEELSKNATALGPFIEQNRITCWYSVPSILSLMTQFGRLEQCDCSSLRIVNFAGEVFPVKYLRRLRELWPKPSFYNLYGPTETNVCTFFTVPKDIPPEREEPYPIGKTCSHCKDLLIGDDGKPVPTGEEGLLHIAGKPVLQGYWADPERTAKAFLSFDGDRYYNTGDVVRPDADGDYVFLGRKDRMVKRHGYRIELGEIEAALYKHPGVAEAAAIAFSQGGDVVTIQAVLSPKPRAQLGIIAMKQHSAATLPAYMIPDTFVFVEKLPQTSTGKIDYQALLRQAGSLLGE
jgi:amino acid adenylation domain-containing protein